MTLSDEQHQSSDECSSSNELTTSTSNGSKRKRSPNKNQFVVWTNALPIYIKHYHKYNETQEPKKFYKLVADEVGYAGYKPAQNAARMYIQKWVDIYVDKTGPNNTGGNKLDLQEITKQHKYTNEKIEELIQSYIPFLGTKRRHAKHGPANKVKGNTSKPATTKDAIIDLTGTKRDVYNLIKENNYMDAKKTKYDNENRLALMDQMALAYTQQKQCAADGNAEMAEFWSSEIERIKEQVQSSNMDE